MQLEAQRSKATDPATEDPKEFKKLKMENQFLKQQLTDLQEQEKDSDVEGLMEQMRKLNDYISRLDNENDELTHSVQKKNELIK